MTYALNGSQFIVLAIGGQSTGALIAFKLPSKARRVSQRLMDVVKGGE